MTIASSKLPNSLRVLGGRDDLAEYAPNHMGLFALEVRFNVSDPGGLIGAALTDGGKDKKADLVYVDRTARTAVVAQCYFGTRNGRPPAVNKVEDVNTALSWVLDPTDETSMEPTLLAASVDLRQAVVDREIDRLEVWFVHNKERSSEVDLALKQVANTATNLLRGLYPDRSIDVRGMQVSPEDLDVWLATSSNQIVIPDTLEVPIEGSGVLTESGDGWEAAYATVSGEFLRMLYEKYTSDKLFAGNIRADLKPRNSDRDINKGIQETANATPSRFWAYNNGVTALVSELRVDKEKLTVRGITIVNGAQTTGSLGRLGVGLPEGVRVLMRFVTSEDSELLERIRRFNNTQNQIVPSDFRSQDAVQTRLVAEFEASKTAKYVGPRRGGESAGARLPAGVLGHDLVAQSLAAFVGRPDIAYHRKKDIWLDNSVYGDLFNSATHAANIVLCSGLVLAIRSRKSGLRKKGEERTIQEGSVYAFLSGRGSEWLFAAAVGGAMESILGFKVTDRLSLGFGSQVSKAIAVEYWHPVVESLLNLHEPLDELASKGDLKNITIVNESVSRFAALTSAVRGGHPSLDTFAAQVEMKS